MASKVKCAFCKEFVKKSDAYRVGFSSFCNRDHFFKYKNEEQARSRKRRRERNDKVPAQTAEFVLDRDGNRCRLCNTTWPLHIHHIRYRSEHPPDPHNENNLITLCNGCHAKVHSDKKKWQPKLLEMISE